MTKSVAVKMDAVDHRQHPELNNIERENEKEDHESVLSRAHPLAATATPTPTPKAKSTSPTRPTQAQPSTRTSHARCHTHSHSLSQSDTMQYEMTPSPTHKHGGLPLARGALPHPGSPRHEQPHETDPMLPTHPPVAHPRALDHVHGHGDHHAHHPHAHATADGPPRPPPKSPRSPTPPTSLSRRVLLAFTSKPTLSKTWENKSYAEQQRSAPVDSDNHFSAHEIGLAQCASPRSRPMSFYASPAEIAAFRPLPIVDSSYAHPHAHAHAHGHSNRHPHSAPNAPAPPAIV